jgi:hypothetical protein
LELVLLQLEQQEHQGSVEMPMIHLAGWNVVLSPPQAFQSFWEVSLDGISLSVMVVVPFRRRSFIGLLSSRIIDNIHYHSELLTFVVVWLMSLSTHKKIARSDEY